MGHVVTRGLSCHISLIKKRQKVETEAYKISQHCLFSLIIINKNTMQQNKKSLKVHDLCNDTQR